MRRNSCMSPAKFAAPPVTLLLCYRIAHHFESKKLGMLCTNSLLANAAKISKRFHCKAYVQTGARMNKEEGGEDGGRVIAIQTLSNAELIKLLQFEVGDDGLMEMVEAELVRRKTGGTKQ